MLYVCLLAVTLSTPFVDSTQTHYANQNAEALRTLLQTAETPFESLLARYRLYPLTEDPSVIDDLPSDPSPNRPARELALLSGLWAYRAGEASLLGAIRNGRRSMNFLEAAKARNPSDPYVLLVEGQSLLFRPSLAGRDVEAAVQRFDRLVDALARHSDTGIAKTEAQMWLWLALRESGRTAEAEALHKALRANALPPLYEQFLEDPPQV
jgi:hypothetical protein